MWITYWYAQGVQLTGLWVMAHECGHHAFSQYQTLNNIVGTVIHSLLLVPYHAWRISHAKHHQFNCSVENDQVFVPMTPDDLWINEILLETPIVNLLIVGLKLLVGWNPGYLLFNLTGPRKYQRRASHFSPSSPIFNATNRLDIIQSNICLVCALLSLVYALYLVGLQNVVFYNWIPYIILNAHLVVITFLHHTDTYIPHYRQPAFTWLRGALCTVDRSFGSVLDMTLHHISDTHVIHHLFHTIP